MRAGMSAEMAGLVEQLAGMPDAESVEEERAQFAALCAPLEPVSGTTVEEVEHPDFRGTWYTTSPAPSRTILYFHGGGFALGSPWHYRGLLSLLAREADARVLAVDYPLAPEYPFPAATESAYAAYRWLIDADVDVAGLALGGDSCGANLALGVAIRARDAGAPAAAALLLISPWVDLSQSGWSYETNRDTDGWITKEAMDLAADIYLSGAGAGQPLASPITGDMARLPPSLIQVGAGESLLAESLLLTERLARRGNAARLEIWPHPVHVWPLWAGRVPEGHAAVRSMAEFLV